MPLSWERFISNEERLAEEQCRHTRRECGLYPDPGDVDCETEPCYNVCKFTKMVIL